MHTLEEKLYLTSPVFVQNALVSYRGRKLLRERFGPEYERWDRFFRESERFQCGVFDGYSQAERDHHLSEEHGICEIVDAVGNPAEPGVLGRLVGTGLHNMAMPLLRYDVGDVVARLTEALRAAGPGAPADDAGVADRVEGEGA